ncbi:hypothetical protein ASZ90_006467 [hydrocarbon metagenome]|uniref:Uncharacterized protein n=1 Tax=hydrocarbon metagenome TaxID=938273 RepID=A0A0W8FS62_9ZZZZ
MGLSGIHNIPGFRPRPRRNDEGALDSGQDHAGMTKELWIPARTTPE